MAAQITKLLRPGKGLRWLWAVGLGVPLILGGVLVLLIVMTLVSPEYHAPNLLIVGDINRYDTDQPIHFEDNRFWVTRLKGDYVVALYDRDPLDSLGKCVIVWRPEYELNGAKGWFRDPCRGSTYDVAGACFEGPCTHGLNRLKVEINAVTIYVDLNQIAEGAPRDTSLPSENPPPQS